MDQRQLDKERIRLTREIAMLEQQLAAAIRGKEEKLEENKQIADEISKLEEENRHLEEETHRLDEEIAQLDEEFKNAQLDAGRLRREIKVNIERSDAQAKKSGELRVEIGRLDKELANLQREIKQEIEDRRNLEARLRKTNSHIDSMKDHWMAKMVTNKLEKQDWYQRQEEPDLSFLSQHDESEEITAGVGATSEATESASAEPEEKKDDEGGIDFSID